MDDRPFDLQVVLSRPHTSKSHQAAAWQTEADEAGFSPADFDTARCAELADELAVYRIMADSDSAFEESVWDWCGYILNHSL